MSEVVFVRETVGERDLVLAFSREGKPLWALDLERELQWWYPGGNTPTVRQEIARAWPGFDLMPVIVRSPELGRHAAVELGRRAEAAAAEAVRDDTADDVVSRLRSRWGAFSRPARLAAVAAGVAVGLIIGASVLGGPPPDPPPLPVGQDGRTVTVPQAASSACQVRGELAHDVDGHLLVCVSDGRADPWTLAWRPVG
jgi:hypothetical protein